MPSFTVWEHVGYTVEAKTGEEALDIFLNADDINEYLDGVTERSVSDENGNPVELDLT